MSGTEFQQDGARGEKVGHYVNVWSKRDQGFLVLEVIPCLVGQFWIERSKIAGNSLLVFDFALSHALCCLS